jgi:hypothetical protein
LPTEALLLLSLLLDSYDNIVSDFRTLANSNDIHDVLAAKAGVQPHIQKQAAN